MMPGTRSQRFARAIKRAVDASAAAAGLVALSPVLAAVATAIRVTMGSPVFFVQERPGLHARPFKLMKFRTMTNAPARSALEDPRNDAVRLTPLGRLLRATSIDELPQLWNVLRGDMSLIGPRPLLMQYVPRYSAEQARRHEVLPGITGWTAINGRNALDWDAKFALDVWYVDHWSLALDLKILLQTVRSVLVREGISNEGHVSMPEFMGARTAPDAAPLTGQS